MVRGPSLRPHQTAHGDLASQDWEAGADLPGRDKERSMKVCKVTMSVLVWMSSKLTTSGDTNSGVPTIALTNQRRLLWSRDRSPPTRAHLTLVPGPSTTALPRSTILRRRPPGWVRR